MNYYKLAFAVLICALVRGAHAQDVDEQGPRYDQAKVFTPLFYPDKGNEFRSASGAPGIKYWQNRADYKLNVSLDTLMHRVSGSALITYTNNSPDPLPFLWLQVEQNIYREDSRGTATTTPTGGRFANKTYTNGDEISGVYIIKNGKAEKADYIVSDTRLQIRLKDTLKTGGSKIQIKIDYAFTVPEYGTDRMGRELTKNGWIYTIGQWYPRMEVYDDVTGWNVIPYLGGAEFYLDYGDYDYTITAPASLLVVGSGALLNPAMVLSPKAIGRLALAANSDKTVPIKDTADIYNNTRHPAKGMLSWHFACKNTRDVAWAASKAFIWDAARINLPNGKKALAQSVYPVESVGKDAWSRSTEFVKGAIELYSKKWIPFTYPVATNVAGTVSGMEYPGIVFCGSDTKGPDFWDVTNHEFGHNWFPMIVGSNERKYAWMDEGFNTFLNWVDTKEFNKGEFYVKADEHRVAKGIFTDEANPIMTLPDVIPDSYTPEASYDKPALGLTILREQILGEDRFDFAFKTYIKRWAFKHPTPWDFFHTMDNAAGEDLSWFWKEWFFTNWKDDQAIKEINYNNGDPENGALITIDNLEQMALPVTISIKEENGKVGIVKLPAEIWEKGGEWTFAYKSTSKIVTAKIDPEHTLPDINPDNNVFSGIPVPAGVTARDVISNYINAIGGQEKLNSIRDLKITDTANIQGLTFIRVGRYKTPGMFVQDVIVPSYDNTVFSHIVVNGDSVKVVEKSTDINVGILDRKAIRQKHKLFPELDYLKPGYTLELAPMLQIINGELVYMVIATTADGIKIRNYYDLKTGLKTREFIDEPGSAVIDLSDYRDTNAGVKIPYSQQTTYLNEPADFKVKEVLLNTGLGTEVFR